MTARAIAPVAGALLLTLACGNDSRPSTGEVNTIKKPAEVGLRDDVVTIPAGEFIGRGLHCSEADIPSAPDPRNDERLWFVKQATRGYVIDRMETSCVAYGQCIDAGACAKNTRGCYDGYAEVELVDAQRYCAWRGMHVVSLAEWQRAIRSTDGRVFPNGKEEFAIASVCPDEGKPCRLLSPDGVHHGIDARDEWTSDMDCTRDPYEASRVVRAPVRVARSANLALVDVEVSGFPAFFRCAR